VTSDARTFPSTTRPAGLSSRLALVVLLVVVLILPL